MFTGVGILTHPQFKTAQLFFVESFVVGPYEERSTRRIPTFQGSRTWFLQPAGGLRTREDHHDATERCNFDTDGDSRTWGASWKIQCKQVVEKDLLSFDSLSLLRFETFLRLRLNEALVDFVRYDVGFQKCRAPKFSFGTARQRARLPAEFEAVTPGPGAYRTHRELPHDPANLRSR